MTCGCLKPKCGSQPAQQFGCDNDGRDVEFIALTEFLPRVTLVAKGVPDDVALEYLRQAAQTLARDSLLLKRELRLDVQAGVRDYYLDGDNEQVHYVSHIQLHNGVKPYTVYDPIRHRYCDHNDYIFEPPDKIILKKTPQADAENRLKVRYFAVPTQNACEVDKLLYDRYHDVVVNGALADLLYMRQYEFADPQLAVLYEKRFKQGITQAKIDVAQGFDTPAHNINHWGRI